ncbi:DUF3592 domain-containing protein [Streptomyces sp. NPDC048106]|uniref:DUF3592 domain-containing protein n=1 Tax=Streptomyces sp. NPDC048106 TaxID=3155750 RepID=UPI0034522D80
MSARLLVRMPDPRMLVPIRGREPRIEASRCGGGTHTMISGIHTAALVAGLVMIPGGIVLGVSGVFAAVRSRRRWATKALTAEAVCLETYVHQSSDGPSSRQAIVEFQTADGVMHRAHVRAGDLVTGDRLTIRHLPDRPDRARREGDSDGAACLTFLAVLFAAALIAGGTIFLLISQQLEPRQDPGPVITNMGWPPPSG